MQYLFDCSIVSDKSSEGPGATKATTSTLKNRCRRKRQTSKTKTESLWEFMLTRSHGRLLIQPCFFSHLDMISHCMDDFDQITKFNFAFMIIRKSLPYPL